MADAGESGGTSMGSSAGEADSAAESMESTVETSIEGSEDGDTDLYSDEGEQELYTSEYDASEIEFDGFLYGSDKSSSYEADMKGLFNEDGEPVDDVPIVADESFIVRDENYNETGEWRIDWESNAQNADSEGFDKDSPITTETLPADTVIARYGSERGRYGTDKGTDYSDLSMPYDPKSQEYHEYRVIEPVSCRKGTVGKNFGQNGQGTQYVFTDSFAEMSNPNNPNRTMERIK